MTGLVIPSSTGLMANVSSLISGSWELVLVALAIPLGFYVIQRIIGLFPKGKK